MKTKTLILSALLTIFLVNTSISQADLGNNTALHPKTVAFALEVYADVVDYQTPEHLAIYSKHIQQVSVENLGSEASDYPPLQSVDLRNKYNPNLTLDREGFDILNFNPLKYHFDFYESYTQRFRVGNSGYVITISPASN